MPVEGPTDTDIGPENIPQIQLLGDLPSRTCAHTLVPGILRPLVDTPSEPSPAGQLQAANDDCEGLVEVKRKNTRSKLGKADLRTNTMTRSICWDDYWEGRAAWHHAWKIGLGLDCMVTIRPRIFQALEAVQRYEQTQAWMRQMRQFYRDNDNELPAYAYLLSREATGSDGTGEHIHWLLPTAGRQDLVEMYLERKLPADREVVVEAAHQWPHILENGKVGNAGTYLLKAACKSVRDRRPNTPFRLSGPVYGQRVFWSTNLNPKRPRYRVPAPKREKDCAA